METQHIFRRAREAARALNRTASERIDRLLLALADAVEAGTEELLAANARDRSRMNPADPAYDRLLLDRGRLLGIAARIALMDPEQEERAFAIFGKLCSIVTARGKDVQTGSPAAEFARERLAPSKEQIQARNLYEAFKDWCYSRDVPPCSMRRFCMILRGFFPVRESNRTYFLCRIRSEEDSPAALTPEVIA